MTRSSWPAFISPPPFIDPATLPPPEDEEVVVVEILVECDDAPLPPPPTRKTKPRRRTVAWLLKHKADLERRIQIQLTKQAEEMRLLEECRELAARLDALKTRTYTVR